MPTPGIDRVLARLEAVVEQAIADDSRDGYFAALYLKVTREIRARIIAGYFDDGPRMDRLDALFAQRYLDALDAYRAGQPVTQSWRIAFDAAPRWRPLILQHLFLGMNAHINLDLGIAAAQVGEGVELESDFMKVNAVLAALTEQVQDAVARPAPLVRVLDFIGGHTDEILTTFTIEVARDGAWELARTLMNEPEAKRPERIETRDAEIAVLAEGLAHPGPLLSTLIFIPRLLERGNPAKITQALVA